MGVEEDITLWEQGTWRPVTTGVTLTPRKGTRPVTARLHDRIYRNGIYVSNFEKQSLFETKLEKDAKASVRGVYSKTLLHADQVQSSSPRSQSSKSVCSGGASSGFPGNIGSSSQQASSVTSLDDAESVRGEIADFESMHLRGSVEEHNSATIQPFGACDIPCLAPETEGVPRKRPPRINTAATQTPTPRTPLSSTKLGTPHSPDELPLTSSSTENLGTPQSKRLLKSPRGSSPARRDSLAHTSSPPKTASSTRSSMVAQRIPFYRCYDVYNSHADVTHSLRVQQGLAARDIHGEPIVGSSVPTSPWRFNSPLSETRKHNFRYEWTDEQLTSKEFQTEFFGRGGPDTEVWQKQIARTPTLSLGQWSGVRAEDNTKAFPPGFSGDFRSALERTSDGSFAFKPFPLTTNGKYTTTLSSFIASAERERDIRAGGKYFANETTPAGWKSPRRERLPAAGWTKGPVAEASLQASLAEGGNFVPMALRLATHDYRGLDEGQAAMDKKWKEHMRQRSMGEDTKGYRPPHARRLATARSDRSLATAYLSARPHTARGSDTSAMMSATII